MGEAKLRRAMATRAIPIVGRDCPPEYRFPDWAKPYLDNVSTIEWALVGDDGSGRFYQHTGCFMTVIVTGGAGPEGREDDGRRWLHVSCAHGDRLPSWSELRMVKDTFIGADKKAIQVLPPASEHINVHPYCLHLWHCADGDGLPDFRTGRPRGVI